MDLCTYLFFDGNAQEAVDLYVNTLGAKLEHLSRFDEAPEVLRPPEGGHLIFHATLRIGQTIINLSDDPSNERGRFGGFALLLHLDREEEVDRFCRGLAEGGNVKLAPQETMWATRYSIVQDKFGVVWKLQYS